MNKHIKRLAGRIMAEATELLEATWYERECSWRTLFLYRTVKKRKTICLYPISPRSLEMISSYVEEMGIGLTELTAKGLPGLVKILASKMDSVLRMCAIATLPSNQCNNTELIHQRADELGRMLQSRQVAQMFTYIFNRIDYESFVEPMELIVRASVTAAHSETIGKEK